jgi:uncharacterized phage protein (TIGR01671 family)
MREIKFRGKRVDNGKWVFGYYHFDDSGDGFDAHYITDLNMDVHEVRPESVGQYTGLKDKNGKEIYEGDIINDSFGDREGRIKYNDYLAAFELCDYDGIHVLTNGNGNSFFEVIGNIYENPISD